MTNQEIVRIAMEQSAIDLHCNAEDLNSGHNRVVISQTDRRARRYLDLPFFCNLVSYGKNIVASVTPEIMGFVKDYINRYPIEHCFETPNIHRLSREFEKYGKSVCFMAEYFLPDVQLQKPLPCAYPIRILGSSEFSGCYTKEWANALCEKRKQLDRLAVAAYDGERMVGMAGASSDCETMWQIGIDVLPEYRNQGIAAALTSRLSAEILQRGIVPFYCAAWSNLASVRNAIRSGFRPAWVELTAIESEKAVALIDRPAAKQEERFEKGD